MNSPSANGDPNTTELMCMKENGQEWKKERKKENGRGTEGWGVGDRQMFGPTYNREHERAQNVPQWSPGDGWDRRHHALEPSQPTLTITTIIHTHIQKDWTCKLIHFRILLTQWDSYCSIFTVSVADCFHPSFTKLLLSLSTTVWWLWPFTASGLH